MKTFRKIIIPVLTLSFFSFFLVPNASAQSSLDAIKARLEGEGISVVDYSSREGEWGSLPANWINVLTDDTGTKFTGIAALAEPLKEDFDALTVLRRKLDTAISEKSRLTIQDEINAKNDEIAGLQEDIQKKETEIKTTIDERVGGADTAGRNLLFKEIDFYFNYSRWGGLPDRIIAFLEYKGFSSLQAIIDDQAALEADEDVLFSDISIILAGLSIPAEEGGTISLSQDDIDLIIDSMAILKASGERQLNEVARALANTIKNIIAGLAVIWIVYAGIRLVLAQGEESVITEQKKALFYAILGLVAILLVGRGIDFLYGPAGVTRMSLTTHDEGLTNEVYGLISFIRALIGIIAILFIIISAIRMMFAAGEESEITKQKTSLLWVGVGLLLIAINQIIVKQLFIIPVSQSDQIKTSNITVIINTIGTVLQFILGFVGLIAFGILIYGAGTLVANYGDDQMVEKAKKIITNAIIGILVIISAYTIVATLVIFR